MWPKVSRIFRIVIFRLILFDLALPKLVTDGFLGAVVGGSVLKQVTPSVK